MGGAGEVMQGPHGQSTRETESLKGFLKELIRFTCSFKNLVRWQEGRKTEGWDSI